MFSYLRFLIALIGLTTFATIVMLFRNVQQSGGDDYAKLLVPARIDFFAVKSENLTSVNSAVPISCYENLYQYANFIDCLQKNGQVYMSFDYVRKKFDVSALVLSLSRLAGCHRL